MPTFINVHFKGKEIRTVQYVTVYTHRDGQLQSLLSTAAASVSPGASVGNNSDDLWSVVIGNWHRSGPSFA